MTTGADARARMVSPCVDVCAIDPDRGLCRGCHRTLDEIARWSQMSDGERARIMTELPERKALGPGASRPPR